MLGRSMTRLSFIAATIGFCFLARPGLAAGPLPEEAPVQYCARIVNDDTLRTPPASMMTDVRRLFDAAPDYPRQASYYRCADANVMLCVVGANLPCGKANTSAALPAATAWCRTNPDADFIPMYVTGHDTIFRWRCAGGVATPGEKARALDVRGFFVDTWKALK